MTLKSRWAASVLPSSGLALLLGSGCQCGGSTTLPPSLDAIADSYADARDSEEASGDAVVDSGTPPTCDDAPETAVASDWPGWRRMTELHPCCQVDVPLDVTKEAPPLAWIPCTNGLAGCQEFKAGWTTDGSKRQFGNVWVARDTAGKPSLLSFIRAFTSSTKPFEFDVYALAASTPLGAFRVSTPRTCNIQVVLGGAEGVTVQGDVEDVGVFVARSSPGDLAKPQSFLKIGGWEELYDKTTLRTSNTLFAFDLQPEGIVVRNPLGTATLSKVKPDVHVNLSFVEGNDVFASSEHGTTGWAEVYRIDSDKSVLLRGKPKTHIWAMRTDGTTLFWEEAYGLDDPTVAQPSHELWTAPYTSDPTTLAATAKKLAVFAGGTGDAVAFSGLWAGTTEPGISVVRFSDGAVQVVKPGSGRVFSRVALVTATEVWALVDSEYPGPSGIALVRVALTPW